MKHRNAWIGIPLALFATIAGLACLDSAARRRIANQPHGRFSQQDVVNRIRELRQISLLPAITSDSVSQVEAIFSDGSVKWFWSVDCFDASGEFAGHVQWDADSGEINVLSRHISHPLIKLPQLTRREALGQTWRLLRQPGIGLPGEPWRLCELPVIHDEVWHINMKSFKRLAFLSIDKHTGNILSMRVYDRTHITNATLAANR